MKKNLTINWASVMTGIALMLSLTAINVAADAGDGDLEVLVKKLGSPSFEERRSAREALKAQLAERPDGAVPFLQDRFEKAEDPEVRLSLRELLKAFARGIPIATHKFDEKAFKAGVWSLMRTSRTGVNKNPHPVFLKDGSVEINSLEDPLESSFFTMPIMSDNARHRTVFEVKVKIVDPGKNRFCSVPTVDDNAHSENLVIYPDGLGTYNRPVAKVKMDTVGEWRTYRVEAEKGSFRVFVDDEKLPAIEVPWTRHATSRPSRSVRFGDVGSLDGARVQFKDIKVSVYEIE